MKLTGSYDIPVDKKTVWDALNNPEILKQSIPKTPKPHIVLYRIIN